MPSPILLIIEALVLITILWCLNTLFMGKGAEYFPTTPRKLRKMFEFANITNNDMVYDLGSGFGSLTIKASKIAKKAVGIEYDYIRYTISKLRETDKAKFIRGDLFEQDISDADVVFLYLRQRTNQKLKSKLSKLKKGTKIISNTWTFEDWKPIKQDKKLKVYMYIIGES